MLIPQGSTFNLVFFAADSTSPAGVPGITSWDTAVSINGGPFSQATGVTLPNPFDGWYVFSVGPPTTNTLGQLAFQATGADPSTGATVVSVLTDVQVVPAAVLNPVIAIQRGVAVAAVPFPLKTATSPPVAMPGLTVTGQRSLDGGALVALTNPVAEIGSGMYSASLTAAETNAAFIALVFNAAGAGQTEFVLATQPQ
jgi:hypothetical protein